MKDIIEKTIEHMEHLYKEEPHNARVLIELLKTRAEGLPKTWKPEEVNKDKNMPQGWYIYRSPDFPLLLYRSYRYWWGHPLLTRTSSVSIYEAEFKYPLWGPIPLPKPSMKHDDK